MRASLQSLIVLSFFVFKAHSAQLEIASYNVENLFDASHEEGKNDFEFLPADHPEFINWCSDEPDRNKWKKRACSKPNNWTDAKLEMKLDQIAGVFSQRFEESGNYPDILALVEIENFDVVQRLAHKMGFAGAIASEGEDPRGVDVGLIFNENENFEFMAFETHLPQTDYPSRPILEVMFRLQNGQPLFVYVNHWPAQFAPVIERLRMAEQLKDLIQQRAFEFPNASFVATGDFNVKSSDSPHPFRDVLYYDNSVNLRDIHSSYRRYQSNNSSAQSQKAGTYYYTGDMAWILLDRFFVSEDLLDHTGVDVRIDSYEIFATPEMLREYTKYDNETREIVGRARNIPDRYDFRTSNEENLGFSDHLPIFISLEW